MHVLDGSEVTVQKISAPGVPPVNLPGGGQTVSVFATFWHPSASLSGITPTPSVILPFATIDFHATNAATGSDSDVDVRATAWNIFHLKPGPGSELLTLMSSDYVYGTPLFDPLQSERAH